jgi:hypothetical protein
VHSEFCSTMRMAAFVHPARWTCRRCTWSQRSPRGAPSPLCHADEAFRVVGTTAPVASVLGSAYNEPRHFRDWVWLGFGKLPQPGRAFVLRM